MIVNGWKNYIPLFRPALVSFNQIDRKLLGARIFFIALTAIGSAVAATYAKANPRSIAKFIIPSAICLIVIDIARSFYAIAHYQPLPSQPIRSTSITSSSSSQPSSITTMATRVQQGPFIDLPPDIIFKIISYLDEKTIFALGATCRTIDLIIDNGQMLQLELSHKFGALTRSERQARVFISPYRNISSFLSFRIQFPRQSFTSPIYQPTKQEEPYLLQISANGMHSVTAYSTLMMLDPHLIRIGGRGYFYSSEYLYNLRHQILRIFDQARSSYDDLDSEPITEDITLQQLRDRFARIHTLRDQIYVITKAWESTLRFHARFCESMSPEEKIAYMPTLFSGMISRNTQNPLEINLQNTPHINPNVFIRGKQVHFCTKTIRYQGEDVSVDITASFFTLGDQIGPYTLFMIKRKNEILGALKVTKTWSLPNQYYSSLQSEDTLHPDRYVTTIKNRYAINAASMDYNWRGIEPDSGDMWIPRLLVQLAVELFLREEFPCLTFTSNHNDGFIFVAAGFDIDGDDKDELKNTWKRQIATARTNQKVFPDYRDLSAFNVTLQKRHKALKHPGEIDSSSSPTSSATTASSSSASSSITRSQLVGNDGKPVLVDFHIDENPMTWEEYLDLHGRLLGDSKEQVLPKFLNTDLEAAANAEAKKNE